MDPSLCLNVTVVTAFEAFFFASAFSGMPSPPLTPFAFLHVLFLDPSPIVLVQSALVLVPYALSLVPCAFFLVPSAILYTRSLLSLLLAAQLVVQPLLLAAQLVVQP